MMLAPPLFTLLSAALLVNGAAGATFPQTDSLGSVGAIEEPVQLSVRGAVLQGTLHVPVDGGPHPAAVLLPGARTSRFLPSVAEDLVAHGIAVLDLHKRGVGGSTGRWDRQDFQGRADDVHAALAFLRGRTEVDADRIGVIGHSQGGWIAQIVAAQDPGLSFVVLLAGPGQSVRDQILTDERIRRERRGLPPEQVERELASLRRQLSLAGSLRHVCTAMRLNYICRIIDFEPTPYLERMHVPVLALFGELDPMVPPEPNVSLLCAGLARAGNEDVTLRVFPRANHDFLEARTGLPDEYPDLSGQYVTGFLDTLTGWLTNRLLDEKVAEPWHHCADLDGPTDGPPDAAPAAPSEVGPADGNGRHTVLPRPILSRSDEARWGAGVAVFHMYTPGIAAMSGRPTTSSLSLFVDQTGAVHARVSLDSHTPRYRFTAGASHAVQTAHFDGIGRDLPLEDGEDYTERSTALSLAVRRRLTEILSGGAEGAVNRFHVLEHPAEGRLGSGVVPGSAGGRVYSVGGVLTVDSRDHVQASRSGFYGDLRLRRADPILGSDYAFTSVSLDTRVFASAGSHVTALHAVFTAASGEVPFQLLPRLGGESLLRGVHPRRHRDRTLAALQVEYRTPTTHRLGAVAFAGTGAVAPDARGLPEAPVFSGGAGLRIVLRSVERLHFRADYAVARGERRLLFGIGEAF